MNIESFRDYCIRKKGVTEEFPFDNETLVFKVMNKLFALTNVEEFDSINLKGDPEENVQLREKHDGIQPGYHMNKKHWNTVLTDGSVNDKLMKEMIDKSYKLVVAGLTKKDRGQLEN
ncbi:MAG TPA: MmcQ/YjbR family DNA-binding protein [Cytophagaceae bacterium]|nr:MmcQ/YjbR family DNA-binding protein [Cytophagaceae bacterium]